MGTSIPAGRPDRPGTAVDSTVSAVSVVSAVSAGRPGRPGTAVAWGARPGVLRTAGLVVLTIAAVASGAAAPGPAAAAAQPRRGEASSCAVRPDAQHVRYVIRSRVLFKTVRGGAKVAVVTRHVVPLDLGRCPAPTSGRGSAFR